MCELSRLRPQFFKRSEGAPADTPMRLGAINRVIAAETSLRRSANLRSSGAPFASLAFRQSR